jgi:cobalamin biosynthesis protein CobW
MASLGSKIPATIITGFLGAGKTSMIQHLLANSGDKRLALIINEFGDMGVDGELVKGCGIPNCDESRVVELANGCICCTVADDFVPAIEALLKLDPQPDHIIIETSGLALPKPLIKAFNWPEVRTRVTVDGVVAVIDGRAVADGLFATDPAALQAAREADESLDHESPLEELFEEQLGCADMIVLNKMDLVEEGSLDKIGAEISKHSRKGVMSIQATNGEVDPMVLLGLESAAEDDLDSRHSHHDDGHEHDHDDFESFQVELGVMDDPSVLDARIARVNVEHDVLRVKGFVDVPGKPLRHVVQAVGGRVQRYFDRPWGDDARRSSLVVIGLHDMDQAAITAILKG